MSATRHLDLAEPPADGEEWSVFLGGDVVYWGGHDDAVADPPVAAPLRDRLAAADVAAVNLEAPVETAADPAPKSGIPMEVVPETPAMLSAAGVDAVTVANNHVMDYGRDALAATLDACDEADLGTCGTGADREAARDPLVVETGGGTLALFSLCEREFGVATDEAAGTAWVNDAGVEARVAAAADEHDAVVVAEHGGVEEMPFSPPDRSRRLRRLVEAGADAVVGHHPHVPQGWEVHDGAPVFHSVGNFYFDMSNPRTHWGLGVELGFVGDALVDCEVVPVELVDGVLHSMGEQSPGPRNPADRFEYLDRLSAPLGDPESLTPYWQEVAERAFLDRHGHSLRTSTGGTLLSLVRDPLSYLRQDGMWDPEDRQVPMLVLLNLTRNESLRATIQTALEVRTGDRPDRRTPAVREDARELISHTTEDPVYDRPHRARELLDALKRKVVG